MTIDKDTVNDKRTVLFPYVEGKEIYNSIVKVDFPTIGYSGQYHVRIKNNAISKKQTRKHQQHQIIKRS